MANAGRRGIVVVIGLVSLAGVLGLVSGEARGESGEALSASVAVVGGVSEEVGAPVFESQAEVSTRGGAKKATIRMRVQVDDGEWRRTRHISARKGQRVSLKVKAEEGASIRWYLVFPDITEEYANATRPWEDPPNDWVGFDAIAYHRMELSALRDRWEVEPF